MIKDDCIFCKLANGQIPCNFVYETEDVFCVWENEFDGNEMHYDLTYFVKSGDKYKRFEDYQRQVYYVPEKILGLLEQCGFDILSLEDDYEEKALSEQTDRIVLTAQKRSTK